MSNQFFFGYGSLVNTSSHDFHDISNARLVGWRRVWQRTNLRDFSFLSVHRSDNFSIDGVIAIVPDGNWRKLDERESGYDRIIGSEMIEHTSLKSDSIFFFIGYQIINFVVLKNVRFY
jgi:cation transport regulator ChaC